MCDRIGRLNLIIFIIPDTLTPGLSDCRLPRQKQKQKEKQKQNSKWNKHSLLFALYIIADSNEPARGRSRRRCSAARL